MKRTALSSPKASAKEGRRLRFFALLCALLFVFTAAACGPNNPPDGSEQVKTDPSGAEESNPTGHSVEVDEGLRRAALALPGTLPVNASYEDVPESFRDALWAFADKTSGQSLGENQEKNALYSPVSLYYPLAMLEGGSDGETRAWLRDLLGFSGEENAGWLRPLYGLLTRDAKGDVEQIANAIWIEERYRPFIKQAWLDLLKDQYYASAFAVDFKDPKTAELMNTWVKDNTNGKIDPKYAPGAFSDDPALVLMNTLYLKTEWWRAYFVDENNTTEVFHAPSGDVAGVTYMNASPSGSFLRGDNWLAGELLLKNGSIRFVLPEEGTAPEDLLRDGDFLSALRKGDWSSCVLKTKLPKFTYRDDINFLEALDALGINEYLGPHADFSLLSDEDLFVSAAGQETFVGLDEKGIEAAAFTYVEMAPTSAAPEQEEVVELTLDRPFLYVIEDSAGAPLFVGIVRNPKAE